MPMQHKVIALISGGKDSLFSILHCLANGHEVVALANLHPPGSSAPTGDGTSAQDGVEDMDSYLYQTIGHGVIPLYEAALGIPLYREPIRGGASITARDYHFAVPTTTTTTHDDEEEEDDQAPDETESLIPLLTRIKRAHPNASALSTGAIYSTYQRTRVESVAVRLGLTPLSFLWQYPLLPPYTQSALLRDMRAVGQEARLVKLATGGLAASDFLWRDVASPEVVEAMMRGLAAFSEPGDGSLLGEGGEYETLAVDGPGVLWKRRIVVEDVVGDEEGKDGDKDCIVWRGMRLRLQEKEEEDDGVGLAQLGRPPLFDDEFARLLDVALPMDPGLPRESVESVEPTKSVESRKSTESSMADPSITLPTNTTSIHGLVYTFANITGETVRGIASTPEVQMTNILLRLHRMMAKHGVPRSAATHCTLLLRDMADFAMVNSVYRQFFDFVNPPSRVTVAVGPSKLPAPLDVMLTVLVHKDTPRDGLHVQSQSYWAPANIGPYSQAIHAPLVFPPASSSSSSSLDDPPPNAGREVHIAGQIPLVPASMDLLTQHGFNGQVLLSLQHLWRIGRATGVRWWTHAVAFLPYDADREAQRDRVYLSQRMWQALHERSSTSRDGDGDDDGDVAEEPYAWRQQFRPKWIDESPRSALPDFSVVRHVECSGTSRSAADVDPEAHGQMCVPPCFVVEVHGLPRGAAIEWSAVGLALSSGAAVSVSSSSSPPSAAFASGHGPSQPGNGAESGSGSGLMEKWTLTRVRLPDVPSCSSPSSKRDGEAKKEEREDVMHGPASTSAPNEEQRQGQKRARAGSEDAATIFQTVELSCTPDASDPEHGTDSDMVKKSHSSPHPQPQTQLQPEMQPYTYDDDYAGWKYATLYASEALTLDPTWAIDATRSQIHDEEADAGIHHIPCFAVWGAGARKVDGVIVGRKA